MAAGGKEKTPTTKKARPKTALERTSPRAAAALSALEKRQDNSSRIRQREDYEANRFKILDSGGTGGDAARYAREQALRDERAGFGYGLPKREKALYDTLTEAGIEFKKGGKVRGCGVAQRGLTKGRMV